VHPSPHPGRASWATLGVLVAAQFMVVLDIAIVNVALPSIGGALDLKAADLSWVVTAYILCSGGLLLIGGRIADGVGRKRAFVVGLVVFTGASLASGLAPSSGFLIGARAVQGIGASVMTPSALALVAVTYEGSQRATALAIWGAVASGGIAVGAVAGGLLTTWLDWRWIFLVNVPVGLIAIGAAVRIVRDEAQRRTGRLDLPGALTAVGGLGTLVYAFSGAAEHGWGSARTLSLIGVAVALLAACALIEARSDDPLVPPRLLRTPTLAAGSVVMLGATGIMAGAFFLNSLYLQSVLHWSALDTGLAFLPLVAMTALGVHATQRLVQQTGTRTLIATGLALVAVGTGLLALAPDHAGYATDLLPGLLVFGLGVGLAFPATSITALSDVEHQQAGMASGLMGTAHEVGAALGVAVLAAIATGATGGPAAGYGAACLAAAVVAAALAVGAALAIPSVRPAAGHAVALH
jgi:EmrB/QacA subfamily drug resistance transporter